MMNNSICYSFLLFAYFICGVTYGMHKYNYVDEIGVVILFFIFIRDACKRKKIKILFKRFVLFLLFYIIYSIWLGLIKVPAILQDVIQQSKPFVAFFCIYYYVPKLNSKQKCFVNILCLVSAVTCTLIWSIESLSYPLLIHPGYYGNVMFISSILYLYTSPCKRTNYIIFFILLIMGLICGRSKYYGEVVCAFYVLLFLNKRIEANLKFALSAIIGLSIILAVSWTKFSVYFLSNNDEAARTVLYMTSFKIFKDFFPFGSGLGSFAEDASRIYYSPLYYEYEINNVFGLGEGEDGMFIADAYYPVVIGQFGIVGIFFFIYFFYYIIKTINFLHSKSNKLKYKLCLLILAALLIESVAGPAIVASIGLSYMVVLAFIISDMKHDSLNEMNNENTSYSI